MKSKARATGRHGAALTIAAALWLPTLHSLAASPLLPSDLVSARSQSGQFVVYAGPSPGSIPPVLEPAKNTGFVRLEPTLVAVSCERIKQLLSRELDAAAPWRGTIYVVLYPAKGASDPITITSERFKNDSHYRVDMPDVVERTRYVRAVVQALLIETANRAARAHAAELPAWLTEGISELLLASNEIEIILPPPRGSVSGVNLSTTEVRGRKEPLEEQAQKKLRGRAPLSFEELSWPTEEQLSGAASDVYSGSAHLFVGELLRLPEGRAGLRGMLAQLPQHHNWQFAFLKAFGSRFERPLDVEKWWALSRAQISGREPAQAWSPEDSWRRLDHALHTAVLVRTATNETPLRAEVPLQTVVREWDSTRQTQALEQTLRQLELLRSRIGQQFAGLVEDYHQAIKAYMERRDRGGAVLPFTRKAGRRRAAETAIQQLDALDARRQAMRPSPKAPDVARPPSSPASPP